MTVRSTPDLRLLSPHELAALDRCLRAVLNDEVAFSDDDFSTIMGVDRQRYRGFVESWPLVFALKPGVSAWPGSTNEGWSLLQNALNNIIGYPHESSLVPPLSDVERLWATIFGSPHGSPIPGGAT